MAPTSNFGLGNADVEDGLDASPAARAFNWYLIFGATKDSGFAANLYFFFGGELPDFLPYHQPLTAAMIFGFFTAGCLVLLESTTQVCVYHGFMGTHESSSGGKKHADDSVAAGYPHSRSTCWAQDAAAPEGSGRRRARGPAAPPQNRFRIFLLLSPLFSELGRRMLVAGLFR